MVASRPLVFALNGSRVEVASPDPALSLLSFLRLHTRFTGTKLSCGEGGCGACLVLLAKYDVKTKKVEECSINSCLTLLCSVDGCAITTIEGLGSTQQGFHAVQERIAGFHGSQCGFCTPGMCMSIYSCLRNKLEEEAPLDLCNGNGHDKSSCRPLQTLPSLSLEDAQKAIVGNICRCTGYRPIIDTCKSFSGQVDIEDLGINAFWSSTKDANVSLLPAYDTGKDPAFPKFLIDELKFRESKAGHEATGNGNSLAISAVDDLSIAYLDGVERVWRKANTMEGVFQLLQSYNAQDDVKLVVGNTMAGYYKDLNPRVFIDISCVPELNVLRETPNALEVGAAVTINKLIHRLEAMSNNVKYRDSVAQGFAIHLKKVANPHVRNRASVGGNLIMAQRFSFDSDLATLFLAVDATLTMVMAGGKTYILSMEEFLRASPLEGGKVLESISIPMWINDKGDDLRSNGDVGGQRCYFKSYRAAPRDLGNALALVNAAFLIEIANKQPTSNNGVDFGNTRLAFGAFGQGHAIRARRVESFLRNRMMSHETLQMAIELLKDDLEPCIRGTRRSNYRLSVAVGYLYKFFHPFLPNIRATSLADSELGWSTPIANGHENGSTKEAANGECHSHGDMKRLHYSGKQNVPVYEDAHSLGLRTQKYQSKLQAAGEAVYVDDIPSPKGCLYAAFVLSSKALAKVKAVDPTLALACPGVVAYISALDIPKGGANLGPAPFGGSENLFATELVEYVGHPLGVMVADTAQHAQDAALKVRVEYDVEGLNPPVLNVEDAVVQNSYFSIPPFIAPSPKGDVEKGFSEAHHKIVNAEVRTGSQYYFYMETQTALAVPDEDGCMLVYNSSQSPEVVQKCLAICLGVPHHNVRVITRRVGGGFGGKAFRNVTVALACAVAANKLRHPVRMYLDRKTDMTMMGGRHPTKTVYSVGFTSDGKVTALKAKTLVDAGWSVDLSAMFAFSVSSSLAKYDWGSLDFDIKICKTNLSSKSAMRAPGHLQGSFIADTVLEHVASFLGLDVHMVITRNILTLDRLEFFHGHSITGGTVGYTLPSMWTTMLDQVEAKRTQVDRFNDSNVWYKRGLSVVPCVYDVFQSPQPARVSIFLDGSVVVEVGGIEMGQGLWTKVEQTAIYGLRQLWAGNSEPPEEFRVRVVQADIISLPHGGITSSSTTSEGSCEAVRQACQLLVDRIMPIKMEQEKQPSGGLSWPNLMKQARSAGVSLSAQVHWFPNQSSLRYLNYGVAASEVEIDILTGAVTILATDLIYDCGRSLNPAVDIGQIEGCFVQGIGFFLTEEVEVDHNGVVVSNGTWNYKPPTLDNIPRQFSVELTTGHAHENRILSSKASGEPPLLLAGSVHSAVRHAIQAARKGRYPEDPFLRIDTPLTMDKVKELCGFTVVEEYLIHQQVVAGIKGTVHPKP